MLESKVKEEKMIREVKSVNVESDPLKPFYESMKKGTFQIIVDLLCSDFKEYLEFADELNYQCQKYGITLTGMLEGYKMWSTIDHSQVRVFDFLNSDGEVDLVVSEQKEIDMAELLLRYLD